MSGGLPSRGGDWHDVLGGEPVSLEQPVELTGLLGRHGVAVLERTE